MKEESEIIKVELSDGTMVNFAITPLPGPRQVSFRKFEFKDILKIIEPLSNDLFNSLKKIQPDKIGVEVGLELSVESNTLTALIVKGSAKGNIKVNLEWNKNDQ